jgi:MFS family permease
MSRKYYLNSVPTILIHSWIHSFIFVKNDIAAIMSNVISGEPSSQEPNSDPSALHEALLPEEIAENPASECEETESSKDIVLACCQKSLKVNHNVLLNIVLSLTYGISNSLWNGTAYAAYLKQLGNGRNGPVGDIEAVNGLASLITALPVGYLADKIGRSKVIAAGGILLFITAILQIGVLEWVGTSNDVHDNDNETTALLIMGVIMALWGVGDGIVNGPASALYADSTPEGQRSVYYNYLFVAYMSASAVGPLVSIVLFQTLGDVWDLYHLRIIIYVGLGMEIFNSLLMLFFDDKKALEESTPQHDGGAAVEPETAEPDAEAITNVPSSTSPSQNQQSRYSILGQKWIPYIVFLQGLIFAIGSGMTVKFFPLFFKDEVGMTPSQVQVVYCVVPVVMVITSTLGSKLAARGFGRVQTTLLFSCLGVSLLYCMVFFKSYLDAHPFALVPIYVMRTSLMNASYPLVESILMDYVPKEERGRWKSLDSVASFGWCGSAALGGMISDKYDYTRTFLITAILQTIGTAVWALLLPLVPRNEGEALRYVATNTTAQENTDSNTNQLTLEEPLLSGD